MFKVNWQAILEYPYSYGVSLLIRTVNDQHDGCRAVADSLRDSLQTGWLDATPIAVPHNVRVRVLNV